MWLEERLAAWPIGTACVSAVMTGCDPAYWTSDAWRRRSLGGLESSEARRGCPPSLSRAAAYVGVIPGPPTGHPRRNRAEQGNQVLRRGGPRLLNQELPPLACGGQSRPREASARGPETYSPNGRQPPGHRTSTGGLPVSSHEEHSRPVPLLRQQQERTSRAPARSLAPQRGRDSMSRLSSLHRAFHRAGLLGHRGRGSRRTAPLCRQGAREGFPLRIDRRRRRPL